MHRRAARAGARAAVVKSDMNAPSSTGANASNNAFEVELMFQQELREGAGGELTPYGGKVLTIEMKYSSERERVISGVQRVSTPGLRVYSASNKIPRVLGGLGVAVISTSRGLMSDREARRRRIGGEVLCYVW